MEDIGMAKKERCDFCKQEVYVRSGGLTMTFTGSADFDEIIRQAAARKFVCPSCGATFCLTCGNKKGYELNTGSTHCPKCGTKVL